MQWVSALIAGLLVLFVGGFGLTAIGMSLWDDFKRHQKDKALAAIARRERMAEKLAQARKYRCDVHADES